jgi:hypothetical protein
VVTLDYPISGVDVGESIISEGIYDLIEGEKNRSKSRLPEGKKPTTRGEKADYQRGSPFSQRPILEGLIDGDFGL